MKLSYKYRLYPTKNQEEILHKNFNFCGFLYNSALQERITYFSKYRKGISYNRQSEALPEIKKEFLDQTKYIYSQSFQQVLMRLDTSFKNFFRRVQQGADKVGFPRFKSPHLYKSLVFPQSDLKTGGIKLLDNNKLKIFGIPGDIKIKMHRPFQGRCKQVIIKRQNNKFYIILSCDDIPLNTLPKTGKSIAIDLGLNTFIVGDDGSKIRHPKPWKTSKQKLAFKQKKLELKKKGSNNHRRAKICLAKNHEKVHNIRLDFLHKTAKQLIEENDIIIMEDLNIKSMLKKKEKDVSTDSNKKKYEAKPENIHDASWGSFAAILLYITLQS